MRELPLLERLDQDIRDRVATPADWYEPFREATWDEALGLAAPPRFELWFLARGECVSVEHAARGRPLAPDQ